MDSKVKRAIAIIPARGGSKRVPRKNIRLFCDTPIIAYSIKAAQGSGCFDKILVSTDDAEIAEIAKRYGAEVPFFRSAENSQDMSMTVDVLLEVLAKFRGVGEDFSFCCCIYPTAPFVSAARLKEGLDRLVSSGAQSVFPVVRFGYPIWRGLKIEAGKVGMIWPENYSVRSQDLEPTYHDAGQFYWTQVDALMRQKKIFMEHSVAIELQESEVQDIDTEEDWTMAELKFKMLRLR